MLLLTFCVKPYLMVGHVFSLEAENYFLPNFADDLVAYPGPWNFVHNNCHTTDSGNLPIDLNIPEDCKLARCFQIPEKQGTLTFESQTFFRRPKEFV